MRERQGWVRPVLLAAFALAAHAQTSVARELIVTGGTVLTMDAQHRIIADGAVAIRGGRIVAVGPRADVEPRFPRARRISAAGRLVMPGLINTHTHAAMSLFRGMADDLRLQEWLEKYIFPAEAKNVTADFVRWGTRLAAIEMLRSGTTTYADMYYFEEVVAEATKEAGMRGVLGQTLIDFPTPDAKTPADGLARAERFLLQFKNDPLIVPAVAPHAPFTCSPELLKQSHALAVKYSAPLLIHVSETEAENRQVQEKYGKSPVAHLDSLGLLGPRTLAAHCVWVSKEDIARLARQRTGVAHNPSSNMKLSSGAAPVVEMLAAGIAVGLGTDGVAGSNNDVNMFEEMDLAAKLAKLVTRDPRSLPARQALEMATILGARAMGMEKEIGSLEAGKRADVITVRLDGIHAIPLYNLESQAVYALKGGDVDDVLVEGRQVVRGGKVLTLDEVRVKAEAQRIAQRIAASLK